VVRLSALRTDRLYPPGNIPGTHFCYRLSGPQGHSATERIMSMKSSNDTIGSRTRNLPACSTVPQPTTPPRPSPSTLLSSSLGPGIPSADTERAPGIFAGYKTYMRITLHATSAYSEETLLYSKGVQIPVARATGSFTFAPNICGSVVRNLLHIILTVPRILKYFLDFWKKFASAN
jgi:hypothetical protein